MACHENLADVLRQHLAWFRKNKMMMTTAASKYTGERSLAQSSVCKALHANTMSASPSMKVIGEKEDSLGAKACVNFAWIS